MIDYSPQLAWIDTQSVRMHELLVQLAGINSWTYNLDGLDAMLSLLSEAFGALEGVSEIVELPAHATVDASGNLIWKPLGKALRIRKRPGASVRVFLCCHADTVYPPDHPFQTVERVDDNTLRGPGVADAKGGLVVMLKALEALEASQRADGIGWEVLINTDEEIGSPGSGRLLIEAAARNHLGLVFEPALAGGDLVSARKGSGTFSAFIKGRAAHAGRDPSLGRNAVNALARFIVDLTQFDGTDEDVTINVGYIEGGGPVNVVPDRAFCRFNVRVATPEGRRIFQRHLEDISEKVRQMDGIGLMLDGAFNRPPKQIDEKTLRWLESIAQCGEQLGLKIGWRPSGGACDGNNLAAAGLPTVDSLGPRGREIHTWSEFVALDSLTERAKLAALLLLKLASGELKPLLRLI